MVRIAPLRYSPWSVSECTPEEMPWWAREDWKPAPKYTNTPTVPFERIIFHHTKGYILPDDAQIDVAKELIEPGQALTTQPGYVHLLVQTAHSLAELRQKERHLCRYMDNIDNAFVARIRDDRFEENGSYLYEREILYIVETTSF